MGSGPVGSGPDWLRPPRGPAFHGKEEAGIAPAGRRRDEPARAPTALEPPARRGPRVRRQPASSVQPLGSPGPPTEGDQAMYARVTRWEGGDADAIRESAERIKNDGASGPPEG